MNRSIISSVLIFVLFIKFESSVANVARNLQCEEKCVSDPAKEAVCLKKARTNLTLVCEQISVVNFNRNHDNKPISGYGVPFFSDNNSYSQINNTFNQLVINNLRGVDSGKNSFQGFDLFNQKKPCNYSIYIYGM
jgi:hypothetical protein